MLELKDIKNLVKNCTNEYQMKQYDPLYDWDKLKDSIQKYDVNEPIVITRINGCHFRKGGENIIKYNIRDGSHRVRILDLLYGPDHKISCVVQELITTQDELGFEASRNKWQRNGRT